MIGSYVLDRDEGLLKHLKDIRSFKHQEDIGFTIEFEFNINEYMHNTLLVKKYYMPASGVVSKIEGTEI